VPSFFSLLVAWEFTPVCEINDADIAVFVTGSMFDTYWYALTALNLVCPCSSDIRPFFSNGLP